MANIERDRLREIKTFPSLVKYLRDELDWPIESSNFDDITFDYAPEELGLDPKTSVKIEEIKQLRPLVTNQPWGIFFIKFAPKQLPVVALRRILGQLVFKNRASSRKSDRASWNLHDLLFISNYGEGEERQITFAHFTQEEDKSDLPTLKVLGWDDEDTALHIDHIHDELKSKLSWPANESDLPAWRKNWAEAFVLRPREVITTSRDLAIRLADLAKRIRRRANRVMKLESERGPLRQLYAAFQKALIHDLKYDDFADMYAQTIAYGLLAARMTRQDNLVAKHISDMVPVANPFLKELLETFLNIGGRKAKIDFDELGIQDIVDLLNDPDTKIDAILRDFGNRARSEDPVVHFYESFLKEYDAALKCRRGVFYTPQPVVSYIVRSVHELLQTEFKLEDGLASTVSWGEISKRDTGILIPDGVSPDSFFVQILDPATGTGTFLVEVIDVVYNHMTAKWTKAGHGEKKQVELWNDYVAKCFLPRIYGYELMMAPYAVAHMKIGLKLIETGYRFGAGERLRVYLTNSLEPATDDYIGSDWFYALAHEAQAVNEIKRHQRFTVVIGNPPYAYESSNTGNWIVSLVRDYYEIDGVSLLERNPKGLQDDYVKFIRFGQMQIDQNGYGILSYITNHGFLDNPTFRGMRHSIMASFDQMYFLNLHGNVKKKEIAPDGSKDENVFDIEQGVCISKFIKSSFITREIISGDLWGDRKAKYHNLLTGSIILSKKNRINPCAPHYLFVTRDETSLLEYEKGWSVTDIFATKSVGIVTSRDEFVIDFDKTILKKRITDFLSDGGNEQKIRERFLKSSDKLRIKEVQKRLKTESWENKIVPCFYRPFDLRYILYDTKLLGRARENVMQHLLNKDNVAILFRRQYKHGSYSYVLVAKDTIEARFMENAYSHVYVNPLYLYHDDLWNKSKVGCKAENFTAKFRHAVDVFHKPCTPEQILGYIYGTLYSPTYRTRYADLLKIDFPRVPLTSSSELFRTLARFGGELMTLHLMESPKLEEHITQFVGDRNPEVEKVTFLDETVWIDKAQTIGFNGVPEAVWNFYIGGYQVCEKWLKERKGRKLSKDDVEHYQKIVVALSETIRLMSEIDKVIDAHGGWPKAFQ